MRALLNLDQTSGRDIVKSRKDGFTLIEMVIAIGILAVLAVGVLRLFVTSQVTHQKVVDIDNAVLETGKLLEEFQKMEDSSQNESRFTVYYDGDWNRSGLKDNSTHYAIYGSIIPLSEEYEGLLHMDLRVVRLGPYPFEKESEPEIYAVSTIIEDLSFWGDNP